MKMEYLLGIIHFFTLPDWMVFKIKAAENTKIVRSSILIPWGYPGIWAKEYLGNNNTKDNMINCNI